MEKTICGVGSDIMQIKLRQRVARLFFPTTHDNNKKLIIKLGTIVHLKTCFWWLISLCWLSVHRRSKFLWKCYRSSVFLLSNRSSTPHRLSVLRKAVFLPSFWHRWGRRSWQIRRNTASCRSRSVSTFFRGYVHLVYGQAQLALTKAVLDGEWLWMTRRIEGLLPVWLKWREGHDCPTFEQFCWRVSSDRQDRPSLGGVRLALALFWSWSWVALAKEGAWSWLALQFLKVQAWEVISWRQLYCPK